MLLTAGLHCAQLYAEQVTPWLRELGVGLSPRGIKFNPRYVHVALNSINPPATDSAVK
jgi:hypothetical protein